MYSNYHLVPIEYSNVVQFYVGTFPITAQKSSSDDGHSLVINFGSPAQQHISTTHTQVQITNSRENFDYHRVYAAVVLGNMYK